MALSNLIARSTASVSGVLATLFLSIGLTSTVPAQATEAESYVRSIADKLEPLLNNGHVTQELMDQFLQSHIADRLDMRRIARYVLRKNWSTLSTDDRTRFMDIFRFTILQSYRNHLVQYARARIRIVRSIEHPPSGVSVITRIRVPSKSPRSLNWRLYRSAEALKIFDISVEGVSKITTARSEYKSVLEKHGFQRLISEICARIEEPRPKTC